jgi:hypothetical protein
VGGADRRLRGRELHQFGQRVLAESLHPRFHTENKLERQQESERPESRPDAPLSRRIARNR